MSSIPQNKQQLLNAIQVHYQKLVLDYQRIPNETVRSKEIEGNVKGTLISPCDTLAYLIGWGQLVLKWVKGTREGKKVDFPETGYGWNQLGLLAQSFQNHYRHTEFSELLLTFERTTSEIIQLVESLDNHTLYGENWYEKWTLGRMIQFNTSSPMKNVRGKVRRFIRQQPEAPG